MEQNDEQFFQDRVDELLVLEKRAGQRAQQLVECNEKLQKRVTESLKIIDTVVNNFGGKIDYELDKLQQLNDFAYRNAKRSILVVAIIAAILMVSGTLWQLKYLFQQIDIAKAELDIKLNQTTAIIEHKGKYYIKIVPGTKIKLREGSGKQARFSSYAEILKVKR